MATMILTDTLRDAIDRVLLTTAEASEKLRIDAEAWDECSALGTRLMIEPTFEVGHIVSFTLWTTNLIQRAVHSGSNGSGVGWDASINAVLVLRNEVEMLES